MTTSKVLRRIFDSSERAPDEQGEAAGGVGVSAERRGRLLVDHYLMLHRYAHRVVGASGNASDVLHDALLVILRHPTGPEDERWFAPWCRGVLRYVAVRSFRSRQRADLMVCVGDEMGNLADDDPDWEVHAAERDLLMRQLEQLDDSARELLHRKYWLGENAGEIAADSAHSAAAVRMRIKRLLDSFAKTDLQESELDPAAASLRDESMTEAPPRSDVRARRDGQRADIED